MRGLWWKISTFKERCRKWSEAEAVGEAVAVAVGEAEAAEEDDTQWEDEDDDSFEEEIINATIPQFPVQVICMEYCENTFDDLILSTDLKEEEWLSAFMQIIMILITYQKSFSFTHNDLHSNNVMYNYTDKKYIYYCYKKKYYIHH